MRAIATIPLRGLALQMALALALVAPVAAQPAPNARPMGGQVAAGAASIANSPFNTNVTQTTNRAAINWNSFDLGRQQSVTFNQPSGTSVILNRVNSGDPSSIAGRISANGEIVLTNPSGVTFFPGAEVNAQSVVVSAAGISNRNLMAGRMVFNGATKPNARIDNRGDISVRQAGLAALVAPSVANSGVINARLGQVILAGAAAHTLDMYGDGLVSIDVTKQVTRAPVGPDGKRVTALVTNTGTIRADGGVVQLTAAAADGVVQTLVRAGGTIRADTAVGTAGRIEVTGVGGSVVVEGRIAADGRAAGERGGQVMVAGGGATTIAPGARITANGRAGGGTIAIGTNLARARGGKGIGVRAGTSARTVVASGARVTADATGHGDGGRIAVLSTTDTVIAGSLSALGGKAGGDGGAIEMSGEQGFSLTGTATTAAPHGAVGKIILDPLDLTIAATGTPNQPPEGTEPNIGFDAGGTAASSYVTPAQLQALTGDLLVQATRNLVVASSLAYAQGSVTLEAGNNLTINSGVSLSVGGSLTLTAAAPDIPDSLASGAVNILGSVAVANLVLNAGTGGIAFGADVNAPTLTINTSGPVTQAAGGLTVGDVFGNAGSIALTSRTNAISGVGRGQQVFSVTGPLGDFSLVDQVPLAIGFPSDVATGALGQGPASIVASGISVQAGRTISLVTDSLTLATGVGFQVSDLSAGTIVIAPFTRGTGVFLSGSTKPAGELSLTTAELARVSASTLQIGQLDSTGTPTAGPITFGNPGEAIDLTRLSGITTLDLLATGAVTQGGALTVNTVGGQAGSLDLPNAGNAIGGLAGFVTSSGADAIRGISQSSGAIGATTLTLGGPFADLPMRNQVGSLGQSSVSGELTLTTTKPLRITGPVATGTGPLTLNGAGITQTSAGTITAPELDGSSSADTVLTNSGNDIQAINSFTQSAGNFALTTSAPTLLFGGIAGPSGSVTATAGSLSFVADGVALAEGAQTGGLSAPHGIIGFAPLTASRRIEVIGATAPDPNSLSLSQQFLDRISAAQVLALGNALSTGPINLANAAETVTFPGQSSVNLRTTGAVTEGVSPGDQDGGGRLAVVAANVSGVVGDIKLAAPGNQILSVGFGTPAAGSLFGLTSATSIDIASSTPIELVNAISANAASGAITITSGGAIQTALGPFAASAVDLTAGGDLTLANAITTGGNLNSVSLTAAGNVTATTGAITTGTLSVSGAAVSLMSTANAFATLGTVVAPGGLTIYDTVPLATNAAIQAGNFSVTDITGGLTINGLVTAANVTVSLQGALTEGPDGKLLATALGGSAASVSLVGVGEVGLGTLEGEANAIGSLVGFSSAGDFTLVNESESLNTGLSLSGTLASSGNVSIVNAGAISLAGNLTAPSVSISAIVSLDSGLFGNTMDGTIAQVGGTIQAGAIALTSQDAFRQSGGSLIGTGAAGSVAIASGGSLTLGGNLAAPTITLAASNVTNTVGGSPVVVPGTIVQSGGTILGSVGGHSDSTTALTANGNEIPSVTGFSSAGGFALTTGRDLAIAGDVTDATAIALNVSGGLALDASLTSASVTLNATGAVSQAAGGLRASNLSGTAASVSLTGAANAVQALQGFQSGSDFSLSNTVPLSIAGAVSVGTGRTLTLLVNSLAFAEGGSLAAPAGTVALGEFTASAGLTVGGATGATETPPVTAQTLSLGTPTGGPLTIAAPFDLSAVTVLELESASTISETGAGAIRVATLTGSGASAKLSGGNQIDTLGAFSATGAFALTDTQALTVSGPLVAASASLAVTGDLSLAGAITTPGSLSLMASEAITQPSGGIVAGSLDGTAASVALGSATNAVASLAGFTTAGAFAFTDGQELTVSAPVSAAQVGLAVTGGGLTLDALVTGGQVAVTVAGAVSEGPEGEIVANILSGSAVSVALANGNAIGTLSGFATTDGFVLAANRGLTVAGPVTDGISISLRAIGPLTVAGTITAPAINLSSTTGPRSEGGITQTSGVINGSDTVTLDSAGAIAQSGGGLLAGILSGSSLGPTTLGGAGNMVGTLPGFASAGGFTLNDARALAVTGPVSDPTNVTLAATALTLGGDVQTGALALTASGGITQVGGGIDAASLTGSAGAVALTQRDNQIATLSSFASGAGFALTDASAVSVVGTVSAAGPLTLVDDASSFAAEGKLYAPGQTVALREFTAGHGVILGGGAGLSGAAPITAATLAIGAPTGGAVTIAGGFNLSSVDTLVLESGGAIVETGDGAIRVAALSGSGASASLGGNNQIGTLGAFATTGAFALADAQALTVSGPLSASAAGLAVTGDLALAGTISVPGYLSLTASGAITQPAGRIVAGDLTGSAAAAALGGPTNAIATLAGFSATGAFALTDDQNLTVSATVSASRIGLGVTGALTLDAPVAGGPVALTATGALNEAGAGSSTPAPTSTPAE